MNTTDLSHRLRVWADMVRADAAHPEYTIELLNEAAGMIDLINQEGISVKREDVEKKLAFEYGGPSKCEYCKHYNMFRGVCNKSSVMPALPLTMSNECDVEDPEPEKCE